MSDATERADLVETLQKHRFLFMRTARDLTDEQARQRSTVSELTIGGLVKHVSQVEARWAAFITQGTAAMAGGSLEDHAASFRMDDDESLAGLLAGYQETAARTDALLTDLPDLDVAHPLPETPWFPPGTRWSARRVALHLIAETAQHAGHADIVREAIDGAKSMG